MLDATWLLSSYLYGNQPKTCLKLQQDTCPNLSPYILFRYWNCTQVEILINSIYAFWQIRKTYLGPKIETELRQQNECSHACFFEQETKGGGICPSRSSCAGSLMWNMQCSQRILWGFEKPKHITDTILRIFLKGSLWSPWKSLLDRLSYLSQWSCCH